MSQELTEDVSRAVPLAKRPKAKRDRKPSDNGTGEGSGKRGLDALLEPLKAGVAVDLSQREIARMVGVGKSSVNRLLHRLVEQGTVVMQTTANGTRLALASV